MSNHKHTFLVDIDGTVANNSDRQHFLRTKPKNWAAYGITIRLDSPHWDVINLVNILSEKYNILFVTGRKELERTDTKWWLENVAKFEFPIIMYMRPYKDYRDDTIIKRELYNEIIETGHDVVGVLDDRNRVVDMWRSIGVRCYQVAAGDF